MRILLVANGFPPFSTHGTEMYTYNLARALRGAGHAVHVFFPIDVGKPVYTLTEGEYNGVPYTGMQRETAPLRDLRMSYSDLAVEPLFVRLLLDFAPDVVHFTYVLSGLSASLIRWAKHLDVATVVTTTDVHFPCMRGQLIDLHNAQCGGPEGGKRCSTVCFASARWGLLPENDLSAGAVVENVWSPRYSETNPLVLRDRYLKTTLNTADAVVAPTQWVYDVLTRWGVLPGRIVQAEYGIDEGVLAPYAYRPTDHVRIGYIGQLLPHKGPQTLFEAFSYCDDPRAELRVYGDYAYPPAESFLQGLTQFTRDQRVRFLGTFPHDRIGAVLSELDVLVVPSIWHENSPLVLRNAVAVGLPVIVANMEGMRPYVHHMENGLLFEAGNVESLAVALQYMLDNPHLLDTFRRHRIHTTTITEDAAMLTRLYTEVCRPTTGVGFQEAVASA